MDFVIVPNKSVGEVLFGLKREEVREIFVGFKGTFKKSKFSKNLTDDFGYCHVFYNAKDECNAVEFFEESTLIYKNRNLFDLQLNELNEMFSDIREEYGSYISVKDSVGIVFGDGKVESILIGCRGYYE